MNKILRSFPAWGVLIAVACGSALPLAARADGQHGRAVPLLPSYRQECSSCHVAYPPGVLPAASWQELMGNLPRHFGTDASVDSATLKELSAWLRANASTRSGSTRPPGDRITRSDWFVREHREVPPRTWKLPAVQSPSNCAACHTTADQGEFNERNVRLPR
jgi:mono/diheme cytochrome c family protein